MVRRGKTSVGAQQNLQPIKYFYETDFTLSSAGSFVTAAVGRSRGVMGIGHLNRKLARES
jgi:hypothetical protein